MLSDEREKYVRELEGAIAEALPWLDQLDPDAALLTHDQNDRLQSLRGRMLDLHQRALRGRMLDLHQRREKPMAVPHEHIMQFFSVIPQPNHALASLWKPFEDLARQIEKLPRNPERTDALRKLLESRDAAVRAAMAGGVQAEMAEPRPVESTDGKPRPGALFHRLVGTDKDIVVYPMTLGRARVCFSFRNDDSILDSYEYDLPAQAIEAAKVWDGELEPPAGWTRHPSSGRHRLGGDPKLEKKRGR